MDKNEEVAHMNDVYMAAHEMLVWLGKAEDGSDHFMDVWSQVGKWTEEWGIMGYYRKKITPSARNPKKN